MKKNMFTLLTLLLSIAQLALKVPVKMALMEAKLEKVRIKRLFLCISFGFVFFLATIISLLITLFLAVSPEHRVIAFSITSLVFMLIAMFCLIKGEAIYKRSYLLGLNTLKLTNKE